MAQWVVRMGNAMLLATVVSARSASPGIDFLPLTVDYREKFAAAAVSLVVFLNVKLDQVIKRY